MSEVKIWILSALAGALFIIVGWVIALFINRLITQLTGVISAINGLTVTIAVHAQQLREGAVTMQEHTEKLAEHDAEIQNVTLNIQEIQIKTGIKS